MTDQISRGPERAEDNDLMGRGQLAMRLVAFIAILLAITLLIAGRWDWWGMWLYAAAYGLVMLGGLPFFDVESDLAAERSTLKADVKGWDKIIASILSLLIPFSFPLLAALDVRLGWTQATIPLWLMLAAAVVFMLGTALGVWAAAVNRFYTRYVRIQTDRGHHVISDGPYRVMRHPGYSGALLTTLAMPLVLGSLWAFVLTMVCGILLVVRTALEDRTLQAELPGYAAYAQQVRYRLLPGIW